MTVFPVGSTNSRPPSRSVQVTTRLPGDEKLGFEGAVAALGKIDDTFVIILFYAIFNNVLTIIFMIR